METSIFIAKLMGPILLVIGIGLIVNRDGYRDMAREFLASRALIYIAGLLAITMGLALVLVHNTWVAGWPVIITLFGWAAFIGGIVRIVFPSRASQIGARLMENQTAMIAAAAVYVILGTILSAAGYLGWFGAAS